MDGIEKLPKWAQEKVYNLERERDTALSQLQKWENEQTPSPFRFEDYVCDGANGPGPTSRTKYVQSYKMTVVHEGIELNVMLRGAAIELSYGLEGRMMGDVTLRPKSYQQMTLERTQ